MNSQLIQKNCTTGEYEDLYPVTSLSDIKDLSTNKTLDKILEEFNHIYLPFKDNSKTLTRLQVFPKLRRQGLWITYVTCKGNTVTEYYNSNDFSNKAWGDSKNWTPYLNKEIVSNLLDEVLAWYKA